MSSLKQFYRVYHRSPWLIAGCVVLFAAVNAALARLGFAGRLPLAMDSVFTAVAAALFGLLPGMLTALLTGLALEAASGLGGQQALLVVCGIATALIVGGAAARGHLRVLHQALWVAMAVCLADSLLGAVVAAFISSGSAGSQIDTVASAFSVLGCGPFPAAFLARFVAGMADKPIAVLAAFIAVRGLSAGLDTEAAALAGGAARSARGE